MKPALLIGVCVLVGCASTDPAGAPSPAAARVDPQLAELQTSLTELLERLDVLNDRIERLEERVSQPVLSGAPAPSPAISRQSTTEPVAPRVVEISPAPAPIVPRVAESSGVAPRQPAATTTTSRSAASRPLAAATIADNYRRGVGLYASGRTTDSRKIFQDVFDADPTGDLADNALFWIGETYFAAGDYPAAMRYYKRVTSEFGDQNKAPDALFKIAFAYEKIGDLALARSSFEEVIRKYPYSTPAASAKQELKRIQY